MAEYIERSKIGLTDFEIILCKGDYKEALKMLLDKIETLPAADVRPVVKAHWTDHRTIEHDGEWYCSACGKEITIYMGADRKDRYKFCPNCGAMMEES